MGILLSGSVQILKEDMFGNRTIVSRMEPGDLFGEAFSCSGSENFTVSAKMCIRDSRCLGC